MTLANAVDDLHRTLEAARIEGPVVLVGHSMGGGYYATMFTDLFPEEVAGLVLIDPAYAGAGLPAVTPKAKADAQKDEDASLAEMKRCADLARAGGLSAADPKSCFDLPARPVAGRARFSDVVLDSAVQI